MRLFIFIMVMMCAAPVYAEDNSFSPEQTGWMQRVLAAEAVGKLKALREAGNWCMFEEQQEAPDPRACQLAEKLRSQSAIREDATMIKTGIKHLKDAEQTPIVREHIRVLEAAMGEIMYNLRSSDAE